MHKKLILLSMLITYMMLTNYSYGEEVTDEEGSKRYLDTAIITEDSESGIMRKNALAAGYQAKTYADDSVVLGAHAVAFLHKGIAVGSRAEVSGTQGSVALGTDSSANRSIKNIVEAVSNKIIDFNGEVSIGNDVILRQITHIAGGTEDTDAANIRQLRALDNKINTIQVAFNQEKVNAEVALGNTHQHEAATKAHAATAQSASNTANQLAADAKTALDNTHQHEAATKTHAATAQSASNTASEFADNAKIALDNTHQHEAAAKAHAATAQSVSNTANQLAADAKTALDNTHQHEAATKTHAATAQSASNTASEFADNAKIALDNTHQHEAAAKAHAATAQSVSNTANQLAADAKTALDNTHQHEAAAKAHAATAQSASNTASEFADNAKIALDKARHYEADFKTAVESTQHSAESTHVSARQAQVLVGQLESEISYIGKMTKQAPDGAIHIGHNLAGDTISIRGKEGDRILTDVANGVRDHDAANISQLNNVHRMTTATQKLTYKNALRINELQHELSKTNKKVAQGLAASAALTGLFQPYNVGTINVTAGFGRYDTTTAIAVGTGYRFNTHAAVKAGFAYSGENNFMYNASFNLEW